MYRYFRAESVEEKNNWLELIEDAKADAIEGRMKGRAGSIPSVGEFFSVYSEIKHFSLLSVFGPQDPLNIVKALLNDFGDLDF